MTQPIYNKKLEHRSVVEPLTTRLMTPEEMIRIFGKVFVPATDFDGKAFKTMVLAPFKTKEQIAVKAKAKMGRKEDPRFLHVTKEFVKAELAAGKTLNAIGVENRMSRSLMYKRAKKFGLYEAKPNTGSGKHRDK